VQGELGGLAPHSFARSYGVRTPADEQAVVELDTTPELSLAPTTLPVTLTAETQNPVAGEVATLKVGTVP
jgi:hypothetical protein